MSPKDVGYLIKTINDKLKVRADADLKRYNLTLTQSRVFAFLNNNGGQATQKEIEVFLEVSHPTVVGIVSRMEQNGYLTSWMDPNDKRNKIVKLTEKADAVGKDMEQSVQENEKNLLRSLSEEDVAHLRKMLLAIYHDLD